MINNFKFFNYITEKKEEIKISHEEWNNLLFMILGLKRHYCFYRNSVYHLIIHGSKKENKVCYHGDWVDFSELSLLVRKELHIPLNKEIAIKVYTCYGGTMPYYVDNKTLVVSAFANQEELNFKPISLNSFEFSYAA